jgi:hypothetical protein
MGVNAQYNVAKPDSLPIKIAGYQRRKMFTAFFSAMRVTADDTILDIGATSEPVLRSFELPRGMVSCPRTHYRYRH